MLREDGRLINLEGDSEHIINRGALCSKGAAMKAAHESDRRVKVPKGPMPQIAPAHYTPSIFEWSMAMGASAATIFIFGYAARRLPILTKEQTAGD